MIPCLECVTTGESVGITYIHNSAVLLYSSVTRSLRSTLEEVEYIHTFHART